MSTRYDVVVVGSGLGGLSAAAELSRRGFRVGVFEKHNQPGGYATTFFRGAFEFEVSLHAMSGIGTASDPGPLYPRLEELGVLSKVDFIPMGDMYRSLGAGVDVTVPRGPDAAVDALCAAFPSDEKGIRAFFRQVLVIGDEAAAFKAGGYSQAPLPMLARFPNLSHAACATVAAVMDRHIRDPRARLAVGQLWGYFGLPPSRLSFLLFAAGLSSYVRWGSSTIRGKSRSLSKAFAEVIRANGGDVHLSCGVHEITVAGGRANGVLTEHGDAYGADVVVSNADPVTTVNRLIRPELVSPAYRRRLEAATPSAGAFSLYLGLSRPSSEVGIRNHEVYLNATADLDAQWQACRGLGEPGVVAVCAYDASNPEFAPPGKGVVALTILSQGDAWTGMDPEAYASAKERMAEILLSRAEAFYPGLRDAVETSTASTPITNMRYTGNPGGAIYGFANTPAENPGFRPDNRGPLDGLWFAGAWTRPSGGYQGVITSGLNTAGLIAASRGEAARSAVGRPPTPVGPGALARLRGYGLVLRDARSVGKVIRAKNRRYGDAPFTSVAEPADRTVARFRAERMPVRLVERRRETADTWTLRFAPVDRTLPSFDAGQYFTVSVTVDGAETSRAYSVSSPPSSRRFIELTVKERKDGAVSRHLARGLRIGETVPLSGPWGELVYNRQRDTPDLVGIAVGSGITPFRSILAELAGRAEGVRFHLIYGSRREEEIVFRDELAALEARHPWLRVTHVLSAPGPAWSGARGRIDRRIIEGALAGGVAGKTFFLCGPRELYRAAVAALLANGVPRSRIRLESYGPPERIEAEEEWPSSVAPQTEFLVRLPRMERPIRVPAGVSLLTSLERAGYRAPCVCRSDACDACTMRLVSGQVFQPVDDLGLRTGHGGDMIHLCSSFPVTDLTIDHR
jgi:prolycopene isomerase